MNPYDLSAMRLAVAMIAEGSAETALDHMETHCRNNPRIVARNILLESLDRANAVSSNSCRQIMATESPDALHPTLNRPYRDVIANEIRTMEKINELRDALCDIDLPLIEV